jgi:hypothetical protein
MEGVHAFHVNLPQFQLSDVEIYTIQRGTHVVDLEVERGRELRV